MRHIIGLCILFLSMLSCNDDDNQPNVLTSDVVGSWNLKAVYADPGDGSGDFQPVDSDKVIEFMANGEFSSNANLCYIFSDVGEASSGVYSEENTTLMISGCDISPTTVNYEIIDSELIVSYFCIEGCLEKYEKVQ